MIGGAGLFFRALRTAVRSGRGAIDDAARDYVAPAIEPRHLRAFASSFAFAADGKVPLGYLFLLAQRAQVATMLAPGFPQPLPGLVHVANEVRQWAALDPGAALQLTCRAGSEGEPGAIRITLQVELGQHGAAFAETRSTYLARRRHGPRGPRPEAPAGIEAPIARYPLAIAAGRDYARLSGDINPIHLWPWSARLFGFRRPIIHGMHTVSSVEAAIARVEGRGLAHIAADFRRPIALPAEVVVHARAGRFQACVGGAVCVDGSYAHSA